MGQPALDTIDNDAFHRNKAGFQFAITATQHAFEFDNAAVLG